MKDLGIGSLIDEFIESVCYGNKSVEMDFVCLI